ncbi:AAA family ATPase [Flavisolibacter ginsenosidimutans]|uniref:AAA family ATPase n=1 Tax=Flavisolibacter ginsenosidimutans TaxID=661481 RepID=A0A5B8UJ35_9BACT|nr:ATP-binding protein [Flavisolibacter ginsenosidimutans]QEC56694.1 AAA family ATPase [Flavisolibacter ginsenosidimutans]
MQENSVYLKEATLGGYKSIKDITIDFKPGLNVIIGKNAAGKTNFLYFLHRMLSFEYENLSDFFARLTLLQNENVFQVKAKGSFKEDIVNGKPFFGGSDLEATFFYNSEVIAEAEDLNSNFFQKIRNYNFLFSTTLITHGIPDNFYFVTKPLNIKVSRTKFSSDLFRIIAEGENVFFPKSILTSFIFLGLLSSEDFTQEGVEKEVNNVLNGIDSLKKHLRSITPIKDIRFNKSLNVLIDKTNGEFSVNNLLLEFYIDDEWYPFDQLSDGTKRLFYIISEVAYSGEYYYAGKAMAVVSKDDGRVILLEEPELGIHPHQLQALLRFLKEQAEDKQIILTTHSPQVLDALSQSDLDRVIIAYSDKQEGTKLRHLTDAEMSKARKYIEEDLLSDYWRFSDLEKKDKYYEDRLSG